MRIEICENTALTAWGIILVVCATMTTMAGCHECEKTNQMAIQSGLVQKHTQNMSSQSVSWQKP